MCIGRSTILGNIFTHLDIRRTTAKFKSIDRNGAVADFESWLLIMDPKWEKIEAERRRFVLSKIDSMKGKKLGCFCEPQLCHGSVYVRLVGTYMDMRSSGNEPYWNTTEGIDVIRGYYQYLKKRVG
jgi:hypothetical protein